MKFKRLSRIFFAVFMFGVNCTLPPVIFAEIITLKSGKTIEGKILEKTDRYVRVEVDGSPLYYELKYIRGIEESLDAKSYFEKGLQYACEAKFKLAEEEFKKGLKRDPEDHNLLEAMRVVDNLNNGLLNEGYAASLFKGSNYLISAKFKEAIEEFKNALSMKPDDVNVNFYLGLCNFQLGQFQDAAAFLQKALEIKADGEIYYYLGACQYSEGQYAQAINSLSKELETNPDDPDAYFIIGSSHYLSGNNPLAEENLNKARQLYDKRGDYTKAKDINNLLSQIYH
ncbi:MAG: hypothetical protein A3K83_03520 [Omnitrophica WOR_2 bacterium RBG_13_44_8b]|nr:MAG: hypothetical protein A3K83_03520 [Omnitrophica WOR_2 bacterium RBG_13_44_8b]